MMDLGGFPAVAHLGGNFHWPLWGASGLRAGPGHLQVEMHVICKCVMCRGEGRGRRGLCRRVRRWAVSLCSPVLAAHAGCCYMLSWQVSVGCLWDRKHDISDCHQVFIAAAPPMWVTVCAVVLGEWQLSPHSAPIPAAVHSCTPSGRGARQRGAARKRLCMWCLSTQGRRGRCCRPSLLCLAFSPPFPAPLLPLPFLLLCFLLAPLSKTFLIKN